MFVVISDALRYEVAASLAEQLRRETQAEVKLQDVQGIFPTITKFGMAALLPHNELKVELQRAKDDPFYQRGKEGMVCEPAPIAEPVFKRGSFATAIRKHRAFQEQWQEDINQKLDERGDQGTVL